VFPNIKRQKEGKEFFYKESVKVFISKNSWNKYLTSNLLPAKNAKRFLKLSQKIN